MNEVEYILRVVLKARDELAGALRRASTELKAFAKAADDNSGKLNALNESMEKTEKLASSLTDKFAEWRAVMQGTAGGNADAKKSFSDLTREMETSVKTTRKAATTVRELTREASAANEAVKKLEKAHKDETVTTGYAIAKYKELGGELDKLSKKFNVGTRDSKRVFEWAENAKKAANILVQAEKIATEEAIAKSKDRIRQTEDEAKAKEKAYKDSVKDLEDFVEAEIKAHREGNKQIALEEEQHIKRQAAAHATALSEGLKADAEAARERARIAKADSDLITNEARATEARRRLGEQKRGKPIDPSIIADAKLAQKEFARLAVEFKHDEEVSRDMRIEFERMSTTLKNTQREVNRTGGVFATLSKHMDKNRDSVAGLDNNMRGIAWLAAFGFANQLITVLGGLAGGFVAVSASAAQAGAAIGGVFVAGIGQALPAIGLLAGALFRVSAVMDVVKQAQLGQKQEAVQAAAAGRRVADATDSIANAQESLANANRAVRDAQEGLTQARKDAREELVDLIQAENDAALAAAGAALSQKEAQQALIAAQSTGDAAGIQRAQLALLQAQDNAEQSIADKRKARRDADKGQAGGVEGTEGVQQAKRALEDAERAAAKAARGIDTAKRNAAEAAAGTQTAAATLNYLLSQLSPAERRLYTALQNIQEAYRKTYRPISDLIIDSFTRSVKGVQRIMLMPEVIQMARSTAREISKQLNRIFDAFTSKPMIDQFLRIAEAGRKNLAPVTDIVISLGKSLANIAEAAGPALTDMLEFIGDLADDFERLTGNKDKMEDFFKTGEEHFEAWVELGLAVIELFAALSGAGGASTGLQLVEDATKAIDGLVKKVEDNKGAVSDFFSDSRDIVHEVVGVIVALAEELHGAFTPDRVKNFADLLKEVLIPALGDAIEFMGKITEWLLDIADHPAGKFFLKLAVSVFLVMKIFGAFIGVLSGFVKGLGFILGPLIDIIKKTGPIEKLGAALGRVVGFIAKFARFPVMGFPLIGWVIAIVTILDQLGLLDDAWREIKSVALAFWDEVKPSLEQLLESIEGLWEAISEGKGVFGLIRGFLGLLVDAFRPLVKVMLVVGGIVMRVFGRVIGRMLGGLIDIISGVIDVLVGIFSGDWKKAWEGAKRIFSGIWKALTALFRALPDLIGEIASKILPTLKDGMEAVWKWLKGLPDRLLRLATAGADAFVEGFKDVGGAILKAIFQGVQGADDFAKSIVNGIIGLVESAINSVDEIGPFNIPDIHVPRLAEGGPVPGSGRGDTVAALLEPGEHVLTRKEVAALGGHAAVFALRRALGGGGQGGRGRYQRGGRADEEGVLAGSLTIAFQGGQLDDFASVWRAFWNILAIAARRGTRLIIEAFRDMRVATARQMQRMYLNVEDGLTEIQNRFKRRGDLIVDSWSDMWMSLKKVTNEGLTYIGHETNKALTSLGENHINFGLTTPKKSDGMAGGGWIGGKGQRGRDRGYYALGAGEAVLNWQHQKQVEPAMHAYYGHGLSDMFRRTRGYHAGGPEQPGFAGGGMVEIDATGKLAANVQLARVIMQMMRRWKFAITAAGEGGHATNSDHHWGGALDLVPGPGGSWALLGQLARAAGWRPNQGGNVATGPFRWVGWNTEASHGEPPRPNAHLHLSWRPGGPFIGPDGMAALESIGKLVVNGIEPLKDLVQASLDKVRKAANQKLDEVFGMGDTGSVELRSGGAAEKVFNYFVDRGLSPAIAAGFTGVFDKESNFSTTVANAQGSGATGLAQWLGGRLTALQAKPNWQSLQTQLDFVWEELHGSESAAFAAIKQARTPAEAAAIIDRMYERSDNILDAPEMAEKYYQMFGDSPDHGPRRRAATGKPPEEFAKGGIVPGPDGAPVPILAHAQEWILNKPQVNRLASMLGVTTTALRSMMGFYGGPGGAQGGTEIASEITPLTEKQVKGISLVRLRKLVESLRTIGENIDKASVEIQPVERWSKFLDTSARALRSVTTRLSRRGIGETNLKRGVMGFLDSMDTLLGDNGVFASLRTAIERRSARAATRLLRRTFKVDDEGVVSTRLGATRVARQTLGQARDLSEDVIEERGDIARSLRQVRRQQRRKGLSNAAKQRLQAQENQLRLALDEAEQRVAESLQSINDAQQAYLDAKIQGQQDAVDKITARYEKETATADLFGRIGEALGNESIIAKVNAAQRDILVRQANELEGRIAKARAVGATDLADQLSAQVADLRVQIFESIQQELRDTQDRINTRAQRRLGAIDLGTRMLDAVGAVGLGGVRGLPGRGELLAQRGGVLRDQRSELNALRARALAEKNNGLVEELNDQIAELDVSIQENTQAAFQAKVSDLEGRTSYSLTLNDLNKRLAELKDTAAGQIDQARLLTLAQGRGNILLEQRAGLEALLAEAQAAGDQQAVQDLTVALLENEIAILENTQAIDEMNGVMRDPQTFTSSAWNWFREAVFTGMGQILPQYDTSNMGINTGAVIYPPAAVASSTVTGGDTNITLNEVGRPVDLTEVSSVVTFARKTVQ